MKARKYNLDSEHAEQATLIKWAHLNRTAIPELKNLFAIPNGGMRHPVVAAQLKAEGVKPGVPDLFLAYPCNGYAGLFIEMKRRVGGRLSPEQRQWREQLSMSGYRVCLCQGWEQAKKDVLEYLTTKTQA
jgi:hypothetical protein